jgi:hypothetical protein
MNRKPKVRDPLADHFARGRIDMAQFRAGREFQKHFALADKRRPVDDEKRLKSLSGEIMPDCIVFSA